MTAPRFCTSVSRTLLVSGIAIATWSCDGPPSAPQPLHPGDVKAFVTAGLAAELTPEGRFPPRAPDPEPYPQISRERAAEIAVAWTRTYGKFFRPTLERSYGGRIDFDALQIVSPVWYAASVYEAVPVDAPRGFRNAFGPHYLLYLGVGGRPVLGVSVAAFAESSINSDGQLVDPPESGSEVIAYGVHPGWGFSMPVSAEQAVRIAALESGGRASSAPELINPHRDYHPYHARWRVPLDRPIVVRPASGGGSRSTRELYVGAHGEIMVPAVVQQDLAGPFPLKSGARFGLRRKAERPVLFEAVKAITQ